MSNRLSQLQRAIESLRESHSVLKSTGDIIAASDGQFLSDLDTPVHLSPNASDGRLLKKHAAALGIQEAEQKSPITDARGHRTCASLWLLDPKPAE